MNECVCVFGRGVTFKQIQDDFTTQKYPRGVSRARGFLRQVLPCCFLLKSRLLTLSPWSSIDLFKLE